LTGSFKTGYYWPGFISLRYKIYAMSYSTIIGTTGVTMLLLAFFLNLFKFVLPASKTYILLNIVGGALSCYASILINYLPFIILEGVWSLVAMAAFVKKIR
jgi:hypothetical protein